MDISEIAHRLEACLREATKLEIERQHTQAYFGSAVKQGDGRNAQLARDILHIQMDAILDNWSSSITLNELLQKALDKPARK